MSSPSSLEGQYTFSDALAQSVPEISALMNQAASEKWDATRFADALQATAWWKTHSQTARQALALQAQDPTEWSRQLTNADEHVRNMAASLGVQLSDDQITQLATTDLFQGSDDTELQKNISTYYTTAPTNAGGTSVTLSSQLRTLASQYGVPVTQSWIDSWVQQSLATGNGTEGAQQDLVNSAKSMFPGLNKQLDAGQTVQQIAQPYIAQMSQVLEVPDSSINLSDRTIQQALQGYTQGSPGAPGGSSSAGGTSSTPTDGVMPLWQFTQQLKQDPRWDQTQNAKDTAYSMLHGLGKSFGFAS